MMKSKSNLNLDECFVALFDRRMTGIDDLQMLSDVIEELRAYRLLFKYVGVDIRDTKDKDSLNREIYDINCNYAPLDEKQEKLIKKYFKGEW